MSDKNIPRVLFLANANSLADGISRHILTLCTYFVSHPEKIQVAVCLTYKTGEFADELRRRHIPVYTLEANTGHDFCIFSRFSRVMNDFRPTVIHNHVMAVYIRLLLAFRYKDVPVVSSIHGINDPVTQDKNKLKVIKNFFRRITESLMLKILRCNEKERCFISSQVKKHFGSEGVVVYNPISIKNKSWDDTLRQRIVSHQEFFNIMQEDYGICLPTNAKIIGLAGRLALVKGIDSFLNVCEKLHSLHSNYYFIIVGCGEEDRLKDTEVAKKLSDRLVWMGYRSDAQKLINAFDVYLMTSWREGLPTVVLEAFTGGTPVCALEGEGGIKEIEELSKQYDNGVWSFIPERNCEVMAHEVETILEDKQHKLYEKHRINGFELVKDYFDIELIGSNLLNIYIAAQNG